MEFVPPAFIDGHKGRLAYRRRDGAGPGVIWLGGFRSDMLGSKANFVDDWARRKGRAFLRFDYSGHGESEGQFEDGSIGDWTRDAVTVFDAQTSGPQILIGSSMGAWVATLLARQRAERVAAIIFIAPAPDFTEALMWPSFSKAQQDALKKNGRIELPSEYSDEPEVITRRLIEDGRKHLVLGGPIPLRCPIRILQGMRDEAVPWAHAMKFAKALESEDVVITLVKNGDHRLSTPDDLARLEAGLEELAG